MIQRLCYRLLFIAALLAVQVAGASTDDIQCPGGISVEVNEEVARAAQRAERLKARRQNIK